MTHSVHVNGNVKRTLINKSNTFNLFLEYWHYFDTYPCACSEALNVEIIFFI